MLTTNIGTPDRILRLVVGAALIVWFFLDPLGSGIWHWAKLILGVILIATAALNFCPIYRALGISTGK